MNRKLAFAALSLAIALGSSSAAMAGAKHHHSGGKTPVDPRQAYPDHPNGGWCNINPSCNGWDAYWQGMHSKTKYGPTGMVIGKI